MKIYKNISRLVTPTGRGAIKCSRMKELCVIRDAAFVVENGLLAYVGGREGVPLEFARAETVDLGGRAVVPGLIDSHTHAAFAGNRATEFRMRLEGASYQEIMAMGGGIVASTDKTRLATEDEIVAQMTPMVAEMKACGLRTIEIKSGYGLETEAELKQLRAAKRIEETGVRVVRTFMGAHAKPKEFADADSYIDYVIGEMLPRVKAENAAEFCDVFCEKGVFGGTQSARLLEAAKSMGFKLKMHADEMCNSESAALAARLGCTSADHLLHISDDGIKALAASNTVATLLPATAMSLREPYAPARKMIDGGCAVALATDFNPGSCYCNSLPMLIALGVYQLDMTLAETITALTLNAAAALGIADKTGSLEMGKVADFAVIDGDTEDFMLYRLGSNCFTTL